MAKTKIRMSGPRPSDSNVIETYGEDFIDGYHLELIADAARENGLQLICWNKSSAKIVPQITHRGQIYRPPTFSASLLRNTRLPIGIGPKLKAAELHAMIAKEFLERIGLTVDDADRITGVLRSSWFADILPTVPSLWISGENDYLGMQILRLASCFCRRPLLLGAIDRGGWNIIADFHPTLLVLDDGDGRGVKAGLRTSSFRGLMSLDGRGISNFCASKIVFSLSSTVYPSLAKSAVLVSVDVATPKPNLLSDLQLNRLSAEFQPLLLAYRIENWRGVLEIPVRCAGVHIPNARDRVSTRGMCSR